MPIDRMLRVIWLGDSSNDMKTPGSS